MKSVHLISYAFSLISVRNRTDVSTWIFEHQYWYQYWRKNVDIRWQGRSFWIIIPDINVILRRYRRKTSILTFISAGKDGGFGLSYPISETLFYVDIETKRRYRRFCDDYIERNVDIGTIMSISGTISCIIYRFEFWQDRVLSCAILIEMLPTMIWMMIAHWMRISASITRIFNFFLYKFTSPNSNLSAGPNGTVLVGYAWLFGRHRRKFAEGLWCTSYSYTTPTTRWHQHPWSNSGEQSEQDLSTLIVPDIV